MHRVVVVAVERVVAFDLSIPGQVFVGAVAGDRYEVAVAGAATGPVKTTSAFELIASSGLEAIELAETVVVPGYERAEPPPRELLAALQRAHARGARLVSICTGAFALAAAGLLDGRRATTHWADTDLLAERYPKVDVRPNVLYVEDGPIFTSAGVAAGIDLCLHIVRRDHGAEVASDAARRIVVAPHREGNQAQYVDRPLELDGGRLAATRHWLLAQLDRPLTVREMADHAHMSVRNFARRFRAETGATPLRWLTAQRVTYARRLLEQTNLPVEQIASQSGFGTAAALRHHFRNELATTPTAYRRTFRDPGLAETH